VDKASTGRLFGRSDQASPFERDLVALMPALRTFALSLCRDRTLANDLAQQALMKAWRAQDSFDPGTNLKAWAFTILRNEFHSLTRRTWRETHWDDDAGERIPAPPDEQEWVLNLSDANRALGELPRNQREALILIGAGGFSLGDAATVCGTPIGTIKSRISRARTNLSKRLESGTPLPRRTGGRSALDDISAQLSALTSATAFGASLR